jgi:2,4-dienoyl-CoA reductase-like NADH-dependent reductase (Old Yellow Enzyme family)
MTMQLFERAHIGTVTLPNRILRSATFEGMCDAQGRPSERYLRHYSSLATQNIGAIITGFAFVSCDGRAMQPGQAGMDSDDKIPRFAATTDSVHRLGGRIFLQIAHAGRQTLPSTTGGAVYSPGRKKSGYFNIKPRRLTTDHAKRIVDDFASATHRARDAGFDGVQLHAGHGYLIHQFLNPAVNDRDDIFGIDPHTGIGTEFLRQVIEHIRSKCGRAFPLIVKISAGDEYRRGMTGASFINLIRFLNTQDIDAIEISWGTMDHALNIFRGTGIPVEAILSYNPRYRARSLLKRSIWKTFVLPIMRRSVMPFTASYNLPFAEAARKHSRVPLICVGGFRSGCDAVDAVENKQIDFVALCRPFIREPSLVFKWQGNIASSSACINCNRCAIMCDSGQPTRCYAPGV